MAQTVKNPLAKQETRVPSLCQEDPLEEGMATHCSILARRLPRTEEPGGLQSVGSQGLGHDWAAQHSSLPSRERAAPCCSSGSALLCPKRVSPSPTLMPDQRRWGPAVLNDAICGPHVSAVGPCVSGCLAARHESPSLWKAAQWPCERPSVPQLRWTQMRVKMGGAGQDGQVVITGMRGTLHYMRSFLLKFALLLFD